MIEEIVVTAQKREQNVQDISLSVTALTPEVLVDNGITVNGGEIETLGLQADVTWIPSERWIITAGLSLIDNEFISRFRHLSKKLHERI